MMRFQVHHECKYSGKYQRKLLRSAFASVSGNPAYKILLIQGMTVNHRGIGDHHLVAISASIDRECRDALIIEQEDGFSVVLPHPSCWKEVGLLTDEYLPAWLDFSLKQRESEASVAWLSDLANNRIPIGDVLFVLGERSGLVSQQKLEGRERTIHEAFFGNGTGDAENEMSATVDIKAVFAWLFRDRVFGVTKRQDMPVESGAVRT
jgi:hypothetical protein